MRRSSRRFASSLKNGQLELLAFRTTVLGINCKEAEQSKQLAKTCSHRAIANHLPPGWTYYVLSTKARRAAFYPLKSNAVVSSGIDRVLPVKHGTLKESYAANGHVFPRESGCSIQLDLGTIMQCLAQLTSH